MTGDQPEDFEAAVEARLSTVERELAQLRERVSAAATDAAAARVLAAGADRDVSEVRAELRAHTQALNALRETQLEQGRMLGEHGRAIAALDQKMTHGFETLHTGMHQLHMLLSRIAPDDLPPD